MAGEIGRVYLMRRMKEAAYAKSLDERQAFVAQVVASRQACGGRELMSAGAPLSGYGVIAFGAEIFPDLESLQKHTQTLAQLNWYRYVEVESFVGTPLIVNEPSYEKPVYQLQLIRGLKEAGYAVSQEQAQAKLKENMASADALGVRRILQLDVRWAREDLMVVQVLEWPNEEALMKHLLFEEQMEWPRYINQRHILGIKAP